MRNFAVVAAVALNCWTAGAWAQPAASQLAPSKTDSELNVLGANVSYRQKLSAGSTISETHSNDKLGNGAVLESTARPLPESRRKSAQNPAVGDVSKTADLQQIKTAGQVRSRVYDTANILNERTDLDRR